MPETTQTPNSKIAGNANQQVQSNIIGSADESYRDVQAQLRNAKPVPKKIEMPWRKVNFAQIGKFITLILLILVLLLTTLCLYLLTSGTPNISIQQASSSSNSTSSSSSSISTTSSSGSSTSSSSTSSASNLVNTDVVIYVSGKFTGSDTITTVEDLPAGTVLAGNYYAVPVTADTNINTPDPINTALSYLTLRTDNYTYSDTTGRLQNIFDAANLSGLTITYTKGANSLIDISLQNPQNISADTVARIKLELERTISYYTPYFEVTLNGKLADYTTWGK